jgi:hypothetical protein
MKIPIYSIEKTMKAIPVFISICLCIGLEAKNVRFYNVTQAPIYFSVYSVEGGGRARSLGAPAEGYYTATPQGDAFLQGQKYSNLGSIVFPWPGQKCQTKNLLGSCVSHYPRTVFFSFEKRDIASGEADFNNPGGIPVTYLNKQLSGTLFQGYSVAGDRAYVLFYNPYGFDVLYAHSGKQGVDIKAGKINAVEANDQAADVLRRYILFANYLFFEN